MVMNDFTASNGMTVERDHNGDVLIDRGAPTMSLFMADGTALALREFFRAEEDERLGRWRWPENPEYVVYPDENSRDYVRIVCEEDGKVTGFKIGFVASSEAEWAARAYFAAHPEPKPWHDAKPGEVWEITRRSFTANAWVLESGAFMYDDESFVFSAEITAGRRIYPEATS
jgi:hypothetical protein